MANVDTGDTGKIPFLLSVFDREQWCPVFEALFTMGDIDPLRRALGPESYDDPELRAVYTLEAGELEQVEAAAGLRFDVSAFDPNSTEVYLHRHHSIRRAPYLIHTGFELPLLLDGRKQLARMGAEYPPKTFPGEERFDHWVEQGLLHREVVMKPLPFAHKRFKGIRDVYYTRKGEEWRSPAMQMLWRVAETTGWNETFERLEGAFFGYEDWQNDWWIEEKRKRGGWGGSAVCCAVTRDGLFWVESAGFRALPPCGNAEMLIEPYDDENPERLRSFLEEKDENVALIAFALPRSARQNLPLRKEARRMVLPAEDVPELNRLLRGEIVVVLRRADTQA